MVQASRVARVWKATGRVVAKMSQETCKVSVTKVYFHPKYRDDVISCRKYRLSDPDNTAEVGDLVHFAACTGVKDNRGDPLNFQILKHVEKRKVAYDKHGNIHIQSSSQFEKKVEKK